MPRCCLLVTRLFVGVVVAGAAGAEPLRFDWTGTVSFAVPALAAAGIVVGTPAVGHYRFESTTPDTDPAPDTGLYDAALLEWRVAAGLIDNTTTLPGFGSLTVALDFEGMGDIYEVRVDPNIALRLQDVDATAFASDALPLTPPPLGLFEAAGLVQLDPGTGQPLVIIDLDTLTVNEVVPALPSWGVGTLALLLTLLSRRAGSLRTRERRRAERPPPSGVSPTRGSIAQSQVAIQS